MHQRTLGLLTATTVSVLASTGSAAVIAGYNFGTTVAPTLVATSKDANVTATDFAFGAQTDQLNQNGNNYNAPPFRAVARKTAASPTDNSGYYVEFTATANAGYELDLSDFSFTGSQGGGTANERSYAIYTSVDGLNLATNSNIASGNDQETGAFSMVRGSATAAAVMPTYDILLTDARYQNLSSFTVRVYFNTVNNAQNIDIDNFVLNGTVSQVVPEPATLSALGAAGAMFLRRRRVQA